MIGHKKEVTRLLGILAFLILIGVNVPQLFDAWQLNSLALKVIDLSVHQQGVQYLDKENRLWLLIETSTNRYVQRVLYQQGLAFQFIGYDRIALQKYNEALNRNVSDIITTFRIGKLLEEIGRKEEALQIWQTSGENISVYFVTQGRLHTQNKNLDLAKLEFQRSILIDPDNFFGYLGLGTVNKMLGDWDSAIDAYRSVLSIAPDDLDANYNLGIAYLKNGDYSESRIQAAKILENYPQYVWAYILMGDTYRLDNKYDQAEDWYSRVIYINSGESLGLKYLGINSIANHKTSVAILYFQQALDISSEPELFFWLGQAYAQQQDKENALKQFKIAAQLSPENHIFHLALADIYLALGQNQDAISEYERVIELDPDNDEAKSKLSQLMDES